MSSFRKVDRFYSCFKDKMLLEIVSILPMESWELKKFHDHDPMTYMFGLQ